MSASRLRLFTPQVRLTNVCVVRYKKSGKRFEVACFKNKVVDWRNGIETKLSEVLQTEQVFSNVSRGRVANRNDLIKVFTTDNPTYCCTEILEKGVLQVSDKERQAASDIKSKDIATMISNMSINTDTKLPFPVSFIENAMKELHFAVNSSKATKVQALELIESIKTILPIERAQMLVRVVIPKQHAKKIKAQIEPHFTEMKQSSWGARGDLEMRATIMPGKFRVINEIIAQQTKNKGRIEVMEHMITRESLLEEEEEELKMAPSTTPLVAPASSFTPSSVPDLSETTSIPSSTTADEDEGRQSAPVASSSMFGGSDEEDGYMII